MVVLNESLQIIDNSMEEHIVIRNRGGRCIVKHPPLFSMDGKYVYVLCGWCVSAYSVQTGECTYQLVTETKEELISIATYGEFLLSITSTGNLTIWKSNVLEKILKLKLAENATVVRIYPVVANEKNDEFNLVVAIREADVKDLQLSLFSTTSGKMLSNLYVRAEDMPHSVSVSDQFVAAIKHDRLTVVSFSSSVKKASMLAGQGRRWMVVACAPEARGLAAGDDTGRILLWPQPQQLQTRAIFHWHTLPVNAITFSATGSYMYSGGGEGVMVRWNVEVSNVRNFLPRLPAPIVHLTVSPDNQYVAIATQDNGIQLADNQNRVSSVIQKLTWGVTPVAGAPLFPAGLVWDPRSRSIVLNGRPGHLQFFNTDENKLLYNLDIAAQNYLTQERYKEVINADVTHVAISHDGKWMVTVETRDDHQTFLETLLKFWQYKFNARQFSLNTCIQHPHQGRVNKIRFQPPNALSDHYLFVTTGTDCKFRVWTPSISESIHSEGLRWVCDSVGYYRELQADCVAFSTDGSVLGVTFGASLTLWDAELCQLNTSLTRDKNVLNAVEFGSKECCHLVVAASDFQLSVWNILTLCVVWAVPIQTSVLCTDPLSCNMAVFTSDNSLFVFSPSNPKPLYEKKNVCKPGNNVLAALFVPRSHTLLDTNALWCADSQLHFIDSNQELQYLELKNEQDPEQSYNRSAGTLAPPTPFSILAAKQSSSSVEKVQATNHVQFGTAGDAAVRKLLKNPSHTMPHIHLFCSTFLKSLAITRETEKEIEQQEQLNSEVKMEVDEDSDSDNVAKISVAKVTNKQNKKRKNKCANNDGNQDTNQSPKKEVKEIPSKRKHRRKPKKEKIPKKRENSFSFDDLNKDWLSVLENK